MGTVNTKQLHVYRRLSKGLPWDHTGCLIDIRIVIQYRQKTGAGDPDPIPSGWQNHVCNRAVFSVLINGNYLVGNVSLNNDGGPMDLENRIPGYPSYPFAHANDRYGTFNLSQSMAEIIAQDPLYLNNNNTITFSLVCACIANENCSHSNCHTEAAWMKIYMGDELFYSGHPSNNTITLENPCKAYSSIEEITDLRIVDQTDTTADLVWSRPESVNPLDHFAIYVDGIHLEDTTDASTIWTVTGLSSNSSQDIYIVPIDSLNQGPTPSNTVTHIP